VEFVISARASVSGDGTLEKAQAQLQPAVTAITQAIVSGKYRELPFEYSFPQRRHGIGTSSRCVAVGVMLTQCSCFSTLLRLCSSCVGLRVVRAIDGAIEGGSPFLSLSTSAQKTHLRRGQAMRRRRIQHKVLG
jgi:hypothetical protein